MQAQVGGVRTIPLLWARPRKNNLKGEASACFGIKMKRAPQRGRYWPRLAVANRVAVNVYDGQHDLRRRGDKGLTRGKSLFEREGPFLNGKIPRLADFEQDLTRDSTQNGPVRAGHDLAVVGHNPGVGRGAFGDIAILVEKPRFAGVPLDSRLPCQHVGQKSDGLDFYAAPAIIRHAPDRNALSGNSLVTAV